MQFTKTVWVRYRPPAPFPDSPSGEFYLIREGEEGFLGVPVAIQQQKFTLLSLSSLIFSPTLGWVEGKHRYIIDKVDLDRLLCGALYQAKLPPPKDMNQAPILLGLAAVPVEIDIEEESLWDDLGIEDADLNPTPRGIQEFSSVEEMDSELYGEDLFY